LLGGAVKTIISNRQPKNLLERQNGKNVFEVVKEG
jgi:hypothetical protein